jgi:hypothetical protein
LRQVSHVDAGLWICSRRKGCEATKYDIVHSGFSKEHTATIAQMIFWFPKSQI